MAVDPDFLMVPRRPMSRLPDVIRPPLVITRPVNVVRPIANLDRYRSRITSMIGAATVIRSTTIIRPVTRVRTVISFAPYRTERSENQVVVQFQSNRSVMGQF